MTPETPNLVHVFNDDLLMGENDPQFAKEQYPKINHVLDDRSLREEFAKYDRAANEARERVRVFGFTTIGASAVALVALATQPVWPHVVWMRWIAAVIELAGMLAAIVAIGGLWLGSWKQRWLKNRLMTERLRQWHFQLMVRRGREIEASCKGQDAVAAFQKEHDRWLAYFLKDHQGKLDSQLESAVNDPVETMAWLHDRPTPYDNGSEILRDIFDAYQLFRFDHQYKYAIHKLESTTEKPFWRFLSWPPAVQRAALSGASGSCFVNALICSVFLVWAHLFGADEQVELYLRTTAIVIALLGVCLRAVQEGLGIEREIDRYKEYRERISLLRDRFKNTSDEKERLHLMEEFEVVSVQEMQDFMRTHQKAKFVLA